MEQYISKTVVVAEIERRITTYKNVSGEDRRIDDLISLKNFLDTLEVVEYKQPEYSYFEYQFGIKPRWNIGDTLAYYEFYTDREGEYVLGKVTKVDFDKEQCDWFYTFENGSIYDEQSLLEEETYKKKM